MKKAIVIMPLAKGSVARVILRMSTISGTIRVKEPDDSIECSVVFCHRESRKGIGSKREIKVVQKAEAEKGSLASA